MYNYIWSVNNIQYQHYKMFKYDIQSYVHVANSCNRCTDGDRKAFWQILE